MVVHRETESQADQHDGQEGQQRLGISDDAEHAFLEDADSHAESSSHRQRETTRGNQRYPDGAEDQEQNNERENQDNRDVWDQNVIKSLGDVIEDWRNTGDAISATGVVGEFCLMRTQRFKSLRGFFISCTRGWGDHDLSCIHVVGHGNNLCVDHAVGGLEISEDFLDGWHAVLLCDLGDVDEGHHWGIAARAEGFVNHVVGLALAGAFGSHAVGRHRQAHLRSWNSSDT